VRPISPAGTSIEYLNVKTGSCQNVPGGINLGSETTANDHRLVLVHEILSIRSEGQNLSVMDLTPIRDEPGRKLK